MISLLNAAPDTGNQGVSALCLSAVDGLSSRGIDQIAVADHGRGARTDRWTVGARKVLVTRFGLSNTKRFWRGDCLRTARTLARLGGGASASARIIARSRAILDVSGGDSFTDLYGPRRFEAMRLTKRLALDNGIPLVLLPQKLGPFRGTDTRREAIEILRRARAVYLRDQLSFDFLQEALGADFDPERHHLGPDMAVLLPASAPERPLPDPIAGWLADDRDAPVAGLNVSGLLTNAPEDYSLAAPHDVQINAVAQAVLNSDPNMRLVLISHVIRPKGDVESDWSAAMALKERLTNYGDRVQVLPQDYAATELKWVMSRLDWFAGARMHATIGAFSSGVPTLGLGYSDKAQGTFDQCGIGDHVADLRRIGTADLYDAVLASVAKRDEMRVQLAGLLPGVKDRARRQMDSIAATVKEADPYRRIDTTAAPAEHPQRRMLA